MDGHIDYPIRYSIFKRRLDSYCRLTIGNNDPPLIKLFSTSLCLCFIVSRLLGVISGGLFPPFCVMSTGQGGILCKSPFFLLLSSS